MQHLTDTQLSELKEKLINEKSTLEKSLGASGHVIDGKDDWSANVPAIDTAEKDVTVQADRIEEFFTHGASVAQLEARLVQVLAALQRIEAKTYGVSIESGEVIEFERLQANPAANTTMTEIKDDGMVSGDENLYTK